MEKVIKAYIRLCEDKCVIVYCHSNVGVTRAGKRCTKRFVVGRGGRPCETGF